MDAADAVSAIAMAPMSPPPTADERPCVARALTSSFKAVRFAFGRVEYAVDRPLESAEYRCAVDAKNEHARVRGARTRDGIAAAAAMTDLIATEFFGGAKGVVGRMASSCATSAREDAWRYIEAGRQTVVSCVVVDGIMTFRIHHANSADVALARTNGPGVQKR